MRAFQFDRLLESHAELASRPCGEADFKLEGRAELEGRFKPDPRQCPEGGTHCAVVALEESRTRPTGRRKPVTGASPHGPFLH